MEAASEARTEARTEAGTAAAAAEAEEEGQRRRRRWEAGGADYLGRDAFSNIQRKLDGFLQ